MHGVIIVYVLFALRVGYDGVWDIGGARLNCK
ncbi:MAG: hypothetical protein ACI8V2_002269 [Candidatus Latescibacterota bacterium]|jgi:hypothetical protein